MEAFLRDVRFGLRMMARNRGFSLVVVLTLALGIGATTAVFSVVYTILLKPLPYPNAERIVFPWRQTPPGVNLGFNEFPWGRVECLYFESHNQTLDTVGGFQGDSFNLTGGGEPVRVPGLRATAGFLPTLGVAPLLGRTYTQDEDQPGHDGEVVLSFQLWRDRFGQDPNVIGKTVSLNGRAYTIIGVMPAGFNFPRGAEMPDMFSLPAEVDLWVPLAFPPGPVIPNEPSETAVIARARAGTTMQQVQADMDVMCAQLEAQTPNGKGWFISRVTPLGRQLTGNTRRPLLMILAAMGVVLLITCFNVANLLIARSLDRQREFSVRAALGAGRARLVRQLMVENLTLAGIGGVIGLLLAQASVDFVRAYGPASLPRLHEVALQPAVFGFALGIALVTGLVFGLLPAISASRTNLVESLRESGQRAGASPAAIRIRGALLVSQIALALLLVISAGLLTQTFFRLFAADPGFKPDHVLTFELSLPSTKYASVPQTVTFYQKALNELRTVQGIEAAGIAEVAPMSGATESTAIRIPDRPPTSARVPRLANYTIVSPGYFAAAGTPILRGRDFQDSDTADSTPVSLINSAMAKKFWPDTDPIGKQVGPGSTKYPAATIVGIVADTKHLSLGEEPIPEMYVPFNQKVWPSLLTMSIVVRAKGDPESVTGGIRSTLSSIDPDLPIAKLTTLKAAVDDSMAGMRFAIALLSGFGAL
ncbi:MAG TPA: ABC transporter permease, partial [Blastocatellia bacterium]